MGAYGYTIENPASIMWTNYKGYDIAEGTSDIMRLIIYREVIGKEWGPALIRLHCENSNHLHHFLNFFLIPSTFWLLKALEKP